MSNNLNFIYRASNREKEHEAKLRKMQMEIKLLKRKTYADKVDDPYFAEGQGSVDEYAYQSADSQ